MKVKIKTKTKTEFTAVVQILINEFLREYPVFTLLNLTETQYEILYKEMIYPQIKTKLNEQYEYDPKLERTWWRDGRKIK